jgi:arylsulfatase
MRKYFNDRGSRADVSTKDTPRKVNRRNILLAGTTLAAAGAIASGNHVRVAQAQQPMQPVTAANGKKPNIILIVSDDFGYGDAGCYLGGEARGMPTPNIDRLANEGMMFTSFYAQPSCTPGRAAMQTGRIPNRSGMTTVAFQGQGGGLPAAEWTLASVLKTGGYKTFFAGKWHLGEADFALPNAQGYDEMKYCGLYHLNAYTYADPTWFPDMDPELRAMFVRVTKGALSGSTGEAAKEDFKINGQYVNTPEKGVVGIPFFDEYVEKASLDYLDRSGNSGQPFFMNINFMKVHQPNMPAPEFKEKSPSKSKYADSVVENDTRISRIMDRCVRSVSTRIPTCSGLPTMARGRTSIPTLATHRSEAPRVRCARAAIGFLQ